MESEILKIKQDLQNGKISCTALVERKIKEGIDECLENGIYPLAWETPHYSAGQEDYKVFARYFDTFFDRVMVTELSSSQQILPYAVKLSDWDVQVIPENLGYLPHGDPNPEQIIENAKNMLVVRDATAAFFFHPFVPTAQPGQHPQAPQDVVAVEPGKRQFQPAGVDDLQVVVVSPVEAVHQEELGSARPQRFVQPLPADHQDRPGRVQALCECAHLGGVS